MVEGKLPKQWWRAVYLTTWVQGSPALQQLPQTLQQIPQKPHLHCGWPRSPLRTDFLFPGGAAVIAEWEPLLAEFLASNSPAQPRRKYKKLY